MNTPFKDHFCIDRPNASDILQVKAPGVYFLSREDVYLSVSLFGHNKRTRLMTADFPLYVQQELVFDKVLPRDVVCVWGGGGYLIPLLHNTNMTITNPLWDLK